MPSMFKIAWKRIHNGCQCVVLIVAASDVFEKAMFVQLKIFCILRIIYYAHLSKPAYSNMYSSPLAHKKEA